MIHTAPISISGEKLSSYVYHGKLCNTFLKFLKLVPQTNPQQNIQILRFSATGRVEQFLNSEPSISK